MFYKCFIRKIDISIQASLNYYMSKAYDLKLYFILMVHNKYKFTLSSTVNCKATSFVKTCVPANVDIVFLNI